MSKLSTKKSKTCWDFLDRELWDKVNAARDTIIIRAKRAANENNRRLKRESHKPLIDFFDRKALRPLDKLAALLIRRSRTALGLQNRNLKKARK
jgi:hypothetical protein